MKVTMTQAAPKSGELIALNDIPDEIKKHAEAIHEHVRKTGSRARLEFASTDERDLVLRQLASYAAQRKAGKLTFRVSPTRGLADTVKDVRLTADLPANGEAAGHGGQGMPSKA